MSKRAKQNKKQARRAEGAQAAHVISFDILGELTFEFVDAKRFKPAYSEEQRDELAHLYGEFKGGACYNGAVICLEGMRREQGNNWVMSLSMGCFFDFLACNIIGGMTDGRFSRYCAASGSRHLSDLVDKLQKTFKNQQRKIRSFEDLARCPKFPNVLAVSALMRDREGVFLLSKRSQDVVVAPSVFGVTVTGSVEAHDMRGTSGPFCECAARELAEETGLAIPDSLYFLRGFAISTDKMQPAAMVDIKRKPIR